LPLVALVATAGAQTKKSFPGAACVAAMSAPDPHGSQAIYYNRSDGSANSTLATGDLKFRCTIMRERPDTSDIANVFARVKNNSSNALSCFVRSCTKDFATCSNSAPPMPQAGTCGAHQTCTLDLASVTGYADGYAHIECTVPARETEYSGVVYYRWED
jgi:hypothetical protein